MAQKRRGHHEGTIKQRSDGRWEAQVSLPDGGRKSLYGRTRQEAQGKLRKALRDLDDGIDLAAGGMTVAAFLQKWLSTAARPSVRRRTYEHYESIVRVRIVPRIGRHRLDRLTPLHVQAMYVDLAASGLSPRSVQHTHRCLHGALEQAIGWRLIAQNPCDRVAPPRADRPQLEVLSAEEVGRLLGASADSPLHALYVLAVTTGMRQGELIGLRWSDVDLERRRLQVRQALQRHKGEGMVATEPKSARSRRQIALSGAACAALEEERGRQRERKALEPQRWEDLDLVFCNDRGAPLDSGRIRTRFHRDLEAAGIKRVRFHDLRHTAATLLLRRNVHPKVVSEMLGHASISLTLDTYSHLVPVMHEEAAAAMDDILAA